MARKLSFEDEAREALLSGVDKLARAVTTTLGPKGRNVAIDRNWQINVINDGVSIAKEIHLTDKFENIGAQIVKGAALKTNDVAGDGTTTAILLAQKLAEKGNHLVNTGSNAMFMKRGVEKAVEIITKEIENMAKPIKTKEETAQVASVSSQDEEIGKIVAEAIHKVKDDGIITVEEANKLGIEVEYTKGMEFDSGAISPYFVTDRDRMEVEIKDNPYILITDMKLGSAEDVVPFLQKFARLSKNLLIIADEVDGEALHTLIQNKMKGHLNVCAVKAPAFGERKEGMLEDIADLTGGRFISVDEGITLEEIDEDDLGQARRVWANRSKTRIIEGAGNKKTVEKRVNYLKALLKESDNEFETQKLKERIAKMSTGAAVIRVGATTEVEMRDKVERVKDAVGSAKAARENGIVAGGGVAYLRAREALREAMDAEEDMDIKAGYTIVYEALIEPVKKILANAGENDRTLTKIEEGKDDFGYDVATRTYGPLIEKGIIDPAKVTKSALQNAASVAGMIITTEALVTEEDKEEDNTPQGRKN